MTTHKIAIVQEPPVLLKRAETIDKVVTTVGRAAGEGAELVIFPETYVPGYPAWIWEMVPGGDDDYQLGHDIFATLL
ncbi:MAG: nitrilase-related carbon-nitrogen hydrolase, partial [Actinomycetota bacterium]|nr:nitrilase-related carbon-nitrogen hydrolase [Actinomycetota bacterium]